MSFNFPFHSTGLRYARVLAGCIALAGLAACASGARTGAMTAPVAPDQIVADNSPIKKAIAVGTVTGGEDTNPLWTSQVSNANFRTALEDSLALSVLKGDATAPYVLNAKLVSLHQPFAGFDMTVTSTVEYSLVPAGKPAPIMSESVVTPYTAKLGDALLGMERLRLANEGAMQENIKEIIARLIKAGQPGGVLSNPAPAKTASAQ
jgi:hypothetical protein